jgi:pimeloyl-ACP methyl ester carboxylesterase
MKRQVQLGAVPVTYTDAGVGEVAVLVHGAGANRNYWKGLCQHLAGYRLLAPDLFGHGDTPPWRVGTSGPSAYAYGDDVDLLEGITADARAPLSLIGHSSGGAVCLEFARRHPERVARLVIAEPMLPTLLAGPAPAAHAEVAGAYQRAHAAVQRGEFAAAAAMLFEYILGDGEWGRLTAGTRAWLEQNVELALAAHSRASLALAVTAADYRPIRAPVLLLAGERTRPPFRAICELLASTLPTARLLIVPGASHNAPITHAAIVNAAIVAFCRERSASTTRPA